MSLNEYFIFAFPGLISSLYLMPFWGTTFFINFLNDHFKVIPWYHAPCAVMYLISSYCVLCNILLPWDRASLKNRHWSPAQVLQVLQRTHCSSLRWHLASWGGDGGGGFSRVVSGAHPDRKGAIWKEHIIKSPLEPAQQTKVQISWSADTSRGQGHYSTSISLLHEIWRVL